MKQVGTEKSITSAKQFLSHLKSSRRVVLPEPTNYCLITHCQYLLDLAKARFRFDCFDIGARRENLIYCFYPESVSPFCVMIASAGAPMAAVMMEELIALGFDNFIATGTVGHLAPLNNSPLCLGDMILVDRALVHEGTSNYYDNRGESVPDKQLQKTLENSLEEVGCIYYRRTVATTDAIYQETPSFINKLLVEGAQAIDMELSAMFSVANFYQKSAASLVYVSDVLSVQGGWELGFTRAENQDVEEKILNVFLNLIEKP